MYLLTSSSHTQFPLFTKCFVTDLFPSQAPFHPLTPIRIKTSCLETRLGIPSQPQGLLLVCDYSHLLSQQTPTEHHHVLLQVSGLLVTLSRGHYLGASQREWILSEEAVQTESLNKWIACCNPETNTALKINYTSIYKKDTPFFKIVLKRIKLSLSNVGS